MRAGSATTFARACSSSPLWRACRFVFYQSSLRVLPSSSMLFLSLSLPCRVLSLSPLSSPRIRSHPGLFASLLI